MVLVALLLAGPVAFFALGLAVRRLWVIALCPPAYGLLYAGMSNGWWGSGVGDAWEIPMLFFIIVSAGLALGGVVSGRKLWP